MRTGGLRALATREPAGVGRTRPTPSGECSDTPKCLTVLSPHFPVNFGLRFSVNARVASLWSSVWKLMSSMA